MKNAHLVPTLHPGGPEIGLVDLAGAAREAGSGSWPAPLPSHMSSRSGTAACPAPAGRVARRGGTADRRAEGVADPGPTPTRSCVAGGGPHWTSTTATCRRTAPMHRDQGHELLLEAVEELPDGQPLIVALAGDGPLRPWLESRVAGTDALRGRVRFVPDARGRPRRRCPEDPHRRHGVLVPPAAGRIADAHAGMTEDTARRDRMGVAARALFLARFEAVGWARRLRTVYASVLA